MKKKLLIISATLNVILVCMLFILLIRLGGIPYVIFKATIGDGSTGVSVGRVEHFQLLPNTKDEIIFLGDSITQQAEWSELLGNSSVKNRGINGNTTTQILKRIDEVVSSKPKKVFLMAGLNDLATTSKETVFARLKEIISLIKKKSANTEIYVQSILPVNNSIRRTGRSNTDIQFINNRLNEYCQNHSMLTWLDLYHLFEGKNGELDPRYTYDGVHLNGAAYLKWRQIILPYL